MWGAPIVADALHPPVVGRRCRTHCGPRASRLLSGRMASDGSRYLHNAASWGVGNDAAPNLAITTMFYGFRRQADGRFAEPFSLAFMDEGDGLIGPYGLSLCRVRMVA